MSVGPAPDVVVSIVTPTYNRAHTLTDVYRSLLDQRLSLEWIIVDDGSSDRTVDLIRGICHEAPFPIRFIRQEHAGKHAAVNRGVSAARGELIGLLDSDDMLTPYALDRLFDHWMNVPDRRDFVGVTGLDIDEKGRVIGDPFQADVIDASWQEMIYRYQIRGDKWGLQRADVLRAHPFPCSGSFVIEGTIWREIGRAYRTRYVNDVFLKVRRSGSDRLSNLSFSSLVPGAIAYYGQTLNDDIGWLIWHPKEFITAAVCFSRGLFHERIPIRGQFSQLNQWRSRTLWAMGLPLGWLLYRRDCRHDRRAVQQAMQSEQVSDL
jgi:glycosyltransferase involved in cell wall biosynthesis